MGEAYKMNPQVQHRMALLSESMKLSGTMLLIRLHLKTVTLEERYELKLRSDRLQELINQEKIKA
jgi:hypothetical protein